MGYEIRIVRGSVITVEDLHQAIADDPEVDIDHNSSGTQKNRRTGKHLTFCSIAWTGGDGWLWPVFGELQDAAGNWVEYGYVESKNPDKRMIAKMKQIAEKLEAKVVGDEGEEY